MLIFLSLNFNGLGQVLYLMYHITVFLHSRILLIDFSKAFDHIDQNIFLNKLKINGVHPTILRWYHNFLQDRQQRVKMNKSTVLNNESPGNYFKLERDVRHGYPLSAYLFILAIKVLANKI